MIGCCGNHLKCQTTGVCVYQETDPNYMNDCMLYQGTIRHTFPILYTMKAKGLVEIENNHLTTEGIRIMNWEFREAANMRLFYILNLIFILGLGHNNRISVVDMKRKMSQIIKVLDI